MVAVVVCSGSRSSSRRDILEVPSARAPSATRGSFCTTCNGQLGTGGGPALLLHTASKATTYNWFSSWDTSFLQYNQLQLDSSYFICHLQQVQIHRGWSKSCVTPVRTANTIALVLSELDISLAWFSHIVDGRLHCPVVQSCLRNHFEIIRTAMNLQSLVQNISSWIKVATRGKKSRARCCCRCT